MLPPRRTKLIPNGEVRRPEYEHFVQMYNVRHSELQLQVKELEIDLNDKMNKLSTDIQKLDEKVGGNNVDKWKLITATCISLLVGYLANYVQHLFGR